MKQNKRQDYEQDPFCQFGGQQSKQEILAKDMTLRDYFAAKAIQCFCNRELMVFFETIDKEDFDKMVAKRAYQIADAMIEERN